WEERALVAGRPPPIRSPYWPVRAVRPPGAIAAAGTGGGEARHSAAPRLPGPGRGARGAAAAGAAARARAAAGDALPTRARPARVQAVDRKDPTLAPFLAERPPHVVFTPRLRAFSHQVVGNETNPYRIAQKLFAAVDRIPWAGAREYSTISNISDHALRAGHA